MKNKKLWQRILTFLCVVSMVISSFAVPAYAAGMQEGDKSSVSVDWLSEFGQYKTSSPNKWGEMEKFTVKKDNMPVYCLEYVKSFNGSPVTGTSLKQTAAWLNLSQAAQTGIIRATLYGYPNNTFGVSANAAYAATQLVIWEYQVGYRTGPTSSNTQFTSYINNNPSVKTAYNALLAKIANHSAKPSFSGQTVELKGIGAGYKQTLTDTTGVLSQYKISSNNPNVVVEQSGNTLSIYAKNSFVGDVTLTATKSETQKGFNNALALTGAGQTLWYGTLDDPVQFAIRVRISAGNLLIKKTAEDGKVSGIQFNVKGNGIDKNATTGSNGEIQIDGLTSGDYIVTEKVQDYYNPQNSQEVTVVPGKTTTVTFNNTLKRGSLQVTKNSEDGLKEGHRFHLFGTSQSGLPVDEYAVTDKNGVATFNNVLISGNTPYTLEEVDTGIQYVIPDKQTAVIKWNEITNNTFTNVLKKFKVDVVKTDEEAGSTPQGDASLAGAVYGIYKGDELIDTYVTDSNGQFSTKYYVCDDDWSIREITPPNGYNPNDTIYKLPAQPGEFEIELSTIHTDVTDRVIKGDIAIFKHNDDGSTGIDHPESGAKFEIYLKSAGSYENAKESERDILVTDENGFAQSKKMPFGTYVVEQTEGKEGLEFMKPFEVIISSDGTTYRYHINNATFESYLKVVKVDSETGKQIPYAGAGFQIYDPNGNLVKMQVTYPTPAVIDTFYTGPDGTLVTPQKLKAGKGYSLVEVQAQNGYVLDSTPIYFDVTPESASVENGLTLIKATKGNMPQKGTIDINKTGEIFSSVSVNGNVYQPVYAEANLAGCVFEIRAAEDITTPDGTIRYKKGTLVDKITTGTSTSKSKPLYLGKYLVNEVQTVNGMVVNSKTIEVTLSYAGQNISITNTAISVYNERQKIKIDLKKLLEEDELFGIGNNGEIQNVQFALYAADDLKAADGKIIPKDGLIEIVNVSKDGTALFSSDLPVGGKFYVQEYSTDEHYVISDEKHFVDFNYAGQDVDVVEVHINSGEAIYNKIIRGDIFGKKIDDEGFAISGAKFGLFKENETDFNEETALMTSTSNPIGVFAFFDVPFGKYIIKEISVSNQFVMSSQAYPVSITENTQVINIVAENKWVKGTVRVIKADAEYTENLLSGAVFEVFADVNNNGIYDEGIDRLAGTLEETEKGIYKLGDLKYGGYFLHEKVSPVHFLADSNYYFFEITSDDVVITVGNNGDLFTNAPEKGFIEITKKDLSNGKPLENVTFQIKDEYGNIVFEGKTDEKGILLHELRVGKYTYQEIATLDGYILDSKVYPFEIKENGEIVKATVTNERIPEPEIPILGDYGQELLCLAFAVNGFAGAFMLWTMFKKKKGKQK